MILGAKSPTGRNYIQTLVAQGVPSDAITAIDIKPSSMSYGEDEVINVVAPDAYKHHEKRARSLVVLAENKQDFIDIADTHLDDDFSVLDLIGRFIDDPDAVLAPQAGKLVVQASATARALYTIVSRLGQTIDSLTVTALLPASTFGTNGMDELYQQTRQFLVTDELDAQVFPKKLAFNLIPYAGDLGEDGQSTEEHRMHMEIKKLMPDVDNVAISAAIAPVFIGLSLNIVMRFPEGEAPTAREAASILRQDRKIHIIDPASELVTASPAEIAGEDGLYISRLHTPAHMKDALSFWVMLDNTAF
jgi:aspartate-semialdehyde dehydrogenase